MSEETENKSYSADSIQVLEGLEAVRKRPAMYIGDIGVKGLHHLVYEVVDNSIDEALAGYATHIEVYINEDNSIRVVDNGRGIPVDMHEKEHKSALEVVLTVLHAGGKFDKGSYKVSGGLHGVGVSCVNALSTYLSAEIRRNGKIYMQEYSCGKPLHDVEIIGETEETGTTIIFRPDDSIFSVTVYDYNILANRLRDLAYLNAGITLSLTDKRTTNDAGEYRKEVFYSKEGLKEFVRYIDSNKEHLIDDVIHIATERQGVPVEVAMTYNTTYNENVYSYVNNINTIEGGTHLTGFRRGLTRTLKKYAEMENDTELSKDQKLLAIQKELEEATALELPMMEQNLPIIGTITTLGTLMGLLGTVIGMIRSFAALAAGGSADSMALSQGISEALINTAFGILTGALAVISYNYYTNKIDKLTYSLDEVGFSIVQTFAATHK